MVTKIQLLESPNLTPLDFCLCGWMKSQVYKRRGGYTKREGQLRRTIRDLRTRVAKCTHVDGGIFERLSAFTKNWNFCVKKSPKHLTKIKNKFNRNISLLPFTTFLHVWVHTALPWLTVHNEAHLQMHLFFLTRIDGITPQNTDPESPCIGTGIPLINIWTRWSVASGPGRITLGCH